MRQAPNAGNRALEHDYYLLRALIKQAPLDWVVVQTNPNCEDRAQASVSATGAIAYLPKIPLFRRQRNSKKRIDVSTPMFPRYLFVGLDLESGMSAGQIHSCDGVEKILSSSMLQAPHLVPLEEMTRILETACEVQIGRKSVSGQLFSIGSNILLVAGLGATLKGVVRDIKPNGEALRVDLQAFGRTTKATVPVDKVSLS
ncbi:MULTISPECIES: transcription termination/antitermination NusG family protein [unclassified Pseudovibrio]|uniref:transcription termination/antitermination NusG family protein n=1 Tax=unclassified Pseudovibrio TaxID=2627060 RepID=UPI0007AED948|nr:MULTISPECIES: transcription termination/antitermination NusG family protein [unclassified Pseudovibrio]KZL02799.1 Transcription antitermination protein RfaH [Pseudovibrio sp. W74]KZL07502.1 Transcription antitermination protein RfaH [Pseudovibrio sp. Ad14]